MTAQISDSLQYNNERFSIYSEPLSSYLKTADLPHPLVAPNTACWRGYTASWAIENKKLFLVGWNGYILNYLQVGMDYLFPGEKVVFANWYNHSIYLPLGELIMQFHGPSPLYQGDRILEFKNGILINEYDKYYTQEEIEEIIERCDDGFD